VTALDHVTLAVDGLKTAEDARGASIALEVARAQVHATLALVEQQRITNGLQLALVDQLAAIAPYLTPVGAQVDPSIRVRDYLDEDQWASIGQGL